MKAYINNIQLFELVYRWSEGNPAPFGIPQGTLFQGEEVNKRSNRLNILLNCADTVSAICKANLKPSHESCICREFKEKQGNNSDLFIPDAVKYC